MSGTASSLSREADHRPAAISASVANRTNTRWRSANSKMRETIKLFLRFHAARSSALQRAEFNEPYAADCSRCDLVACVQSVFDSDEPFEGRARLHFCAREMFAVGDVNVIAISGVEQRRKRHGEDG